MAVVCRLRILHTSMRLNCGSPCWTMMRMVSFSVNWNVWRLIFFDMIVIVFVQRGGGAVWLPRFPFCGFIKFGLLIFFFFSYVYGGLRCQCALGFFFLFFDSGSVAP